MNYPSTVKELTETLRQGDYLADRGLATAVFVAMSLQRPLLLEGEVGVGKTQIAKVLASVFERKLIRLQCYEGIDTNQALYEWDYARQLLYIRALSDRDVGDEEALEKLFGPRFLLGQLKTQLLLHCLLGSNNHNSNSNNSNNLMHLLMVAGHNNNNTNPNI